MALLRSRARRPYTCGECGGPIPKGATYLRDEPHPRARYHRGAEVRYVCGPCSGLTPAPTPVNVEDQDLADDEIDQALRTNRLRIGMVPTDSQQALLRQRRGQRRIHQLTVENYRGRCAVCDVMDPALLVASHVVGWAEAPESRGDLSNVICLCRIHDALFEAGYWSLGDSLELLKKEAVTSKTIRQLLDGMISFQQPLEHPPAPCFTQHHRERAGFEAERR